MDDIISAIDELFFKQWAYNTAKLIEELHRQPRRIMLKTKLHLVCL